LYNKSEANAGLTANLVFENIHKCSVDKILPVIENYKHIILRSYIDYESK